ncbi:MAG TPA: DUF433 domain-containing protein [Blastocatellia bacterium]|nr:DUF433 domain-containing protein [Blastocatellia bacterium]
MNIDQLVEVDPEKMSGTPVFTGTRVPVSNLFDYLEGGDSLEVFLDDFPTVSKEQAQGVLEASRQLLLEKYEYEDLRPLVPQALESLKTIQPGDVV